MMLHFWTDYTPKDPETLRRNRVAEMTWQRQPWTERGIKDAELPELVMEAGKSLPHVRDVFDAGCKGLADEDIAVYTNRDIGCHSRCGEMLAAALDGSDAVYAFRRDFYHDYTTPIPDGDIAKGMPYAGSDLYAFRAGWWRTWREEFPYEMCMGAEAWDPIMRVLMEQTNPGKVVEVRDVIYHQFHNPWWLRPEHRYQLEIQKKCLRAASRWFVEHGREPGEFGIPEIFNHGLHGLHG